MIIKATDEYNRHRYIPYDSNGNMRTDVTWFDTVTGRYAVYNIKDGERLVDIDCEPDGTYIYDFEKGERIFASDEEG